LPSIFIPTLITRRTPGGCGPWRLTCARQRKLSDDAAFAHYLNLRAQALLTDDYYASDVAWLDLKNPKVDLIFAPYETYLDGVLGVKTSYGGAILVRNEAESRKLYLYRKQEAAMQQALPIPADDRPSKEGQATPMEVVDAPLRAGDLQLRLPSRGGQSAQRIRASTRRRDRRRSSSRTSWTRA